MPKQYLHRQAGPSWGPRSTAAAAARCSPAVACSTGRHAGAARQCPPFSLGCTPVWMSVAGVQAHTSAASNAASQDTERSCNMILNQHGLLLGSGLSGGF